MQDPSKPFEWLKKTKSWLKHPQDQVSSWFKIQLGPGLNIKLSRHNNQNSSSNIIVWFLLLPTERRKEKEKKKEKGGERNQEERKKIAKKIQVAAEMQNIP